MDQYGGARYEEIGKLLHDEAIVGEVVKKYSEELGEFRAIDLGAGTGHTTKSVIDANPCIQVFGVDNSQERLDIAQANLQGHGIVFVNADAHEYLSQQRNWSFDLVYSAFTMHGIEKEKRKKIYNEVHRILKPGGFFIDYDISFGLPDETKRLVNLMKIFSNGRKTNQINREEFETWIDHIIEERSEGFYMTLDERLKALSEAGFHNNVEYIDPNLNNVLVSSRKSN